MPSPTAHQDESHADRVIELLDGRLVSTGEAD